MAEVAVGAAAPLASRGRRLVWRIMMGGAAATLLMAGLHVGPGKRVLALFGGGAAAGCPVSLKGLSPAEVEAQRAATSRELAGARAAKTRQVGPFTVGVSRRDDVLAWAAGAGATCSDVHEGTALRCSAASPKAFLADALVPSEVFVRVDPTGRVVAFDAVAELTAEEVGGAIGRAVQSLDATLGPERRVLGDLTPSYFLGVGVRGTVVEYRFSDLAVDVSAARTRDEGPLRFRLQARLVGG